ncbi:LysR family transcriptional regulator [Marivibrio halodurans]|uniref:LysR family transcriptional regulator n=1 Tax=Marivibrio halodurans TaxID=2039722 RepID=A0A8J7S3S1_9PROT|nr:LysR family transcriptional regulator [Marivibrio halodurans]MBP5856179.1 LysR family transcriptional regulator [Marivibrio halodurans]
MLLAQLTVFLAILERGSMVAASRELSLSPATVSERLTALEAHYGVRLLHRTTRSISPTEEGRALVEGAQRLLAEAAEIDARLRLGREHVAGPVRLSAPSDIGRNRIAPLLDSFQDKHPEVRIDLHLSDGNVDLAAQGFDMAVRYGDLQDSSLMVRRLADNARLICAAPAYLERYGEPEHPEDLARHNCLVMRFGGTPDRIWPFVIDGTTRRIAVGGNRIANDGEAVRHWCIAGHGIARKSEWDIADDLRAGRLVPILRAFEAPAIGLQVVYPKGRVAVRRIAMLIDTLADAFSHGRYVEEEGA